ncbi:MAG: FkbM family methyltransferase [Rhizobiaceae bacterium]
MAIRSLQKLEGRFRRLRDRALGNALFGAGITAKAFLRHLGARGDLIVRTLADHRIVLDPGDHTLSYSLMREGTWQRWELDRAVSFLAARGALPPGGLFVDVGANIGTQTVYAMLTGAFGGAVAIEPEPRCFDILQLNVAVNGFADRVRTVRSAVGATSGELPFMVEAGNRAAHSLVRALTATSGVSINVPVRPLPDLLAGCGADPASVGMVWIDVEGYEPDVLAGMPGLLARSVPLVIETNPHLYAGGIDALASILIPHYDMFVDLAEALLVPRPIGDLTQITGQHDVAVFRGG